MSANKGHVGGGRVVGIANAYATAGRLDDAIPLYEQTLQDSLRVLGPDHPDTLNTQNNLANAYRAAGRLDDAIPLLEQTLQDSLRVLGPDHPDTLQPRRSTPGKWCTRCISTAT